MIKINSQVWHLNFAWNSKLSRSCYFCFN